MTSRVEVTRPLRPGSKTGVRPDIQALRALAVSLVVVYHLWPDRLQGGYVGVDVFFAISGFLITSHLYRQVERSGTVGLRSFYSRRIRRLLPASLLVLLLVGIVTLLFVPVRLWTVTGENIVASATYVENWSLVANAVNYLGASTNTIPTQHFWSLSVEEQFYAFWPLLLVVAVTLLARTKGNQLRYAVGVIGVVGLASFVYSIWSTDYDQASAYFNTFSRVWEFAAGAVAALVLPRVRIPRVPATVLVWMGIVAICVASILFKDSSPFPGWIAAVPVLGALAVIAGSPSAGRLSPAPFFALRPVQFLGDISYSVYLWHWPIIVLVPIISLRSLTTTTRLLIIVASIVLAWISKRYVEDPFRADARGRAGERMSRLPNGRVFIAALAGMVVVSSVGAGIYLAGDAKVAAAQKQLAALPSRAAMSCFGSSALPNFSCDGSNGLGDTVYPNPIIATDSDGGQNCQQTELSTALLTCTFGAKSDPTERVALAGDSHAGEWLAAMQGAARTNQWRLDTYLKSGCGLSLNPVSGIGSAARCETWNQEAVRELIAKHYDLVVVSTRSTPVGGGAMSAQQQKTVADGMARAWKQLIAHGIAVVAIRDTPAPLSDGVTNVPACVLDSHAPEVSCAVRQSKAVQADPQSLAVAQTAGARLITLTQDFCARSVCPPIIGNVLVYIDGHHMSSLYSSTLAGSLAAELKRAEPSLR
jgi:peptidoglycan/LPS O-acetylase OafA/YrhL